MQCLNKQEVFARLLDNNYEPEEAIELVNLIFGPTAQPQDSEPGDDPGSGAPPKDGGGHG